MTTDTLEPTGEQQVHDDEHVGHEVIGPPLTAWEAGVAVGLGVIALLMAGAMPLLLGALASLHRIEVSRIGDTAMAEALTMGLSTTACATFVRPHRLRL